MSKEDYISICRQLYNSITVVKGFVQLNSNLNNVNYSLMVLQASENMEALVNEIVDLINDDGKDS